MRGKQAKRKRRVKMKHREKVSMKKGKNSRSMLAEPAFKSPRDNKSSNVYYVN